MLYFIVVRFECFVSVLCVCFFYINYFISIERFFMNISVFKPFIYIYTLACNAIIGHLL